MAHFFKYTFVFIILATCVQGFTPLSRPTSLQNIKKGIKKKQFTSIRPIIHKTRGGILKSWNVRDPKGVSDFPLAPQRIGVTILSTYLTWYAQAQYSSVMASSAVTLICSMIFDKRLGQAAFCGTFAGMCSKAIIPSSSLALYLGALTSLLFEILIHYQNVFLGVGGRLGMTAFLATSIVTAVTGVSTGFKVSALTIKALKKKVILPMMLWHAVGSVATIVLREVSDESAAADPVRASAVVGLIGALLLEEKTAALAVYGGSFVGMSLPSRLINGRRGSSQPLSILSILVAFASAGALGGIVHGATINWKVYANGWGGKAGTCAFLGCLLYRFVSSILSTALGR